MFVYYFVIVAASNDAVERRLGAALDGMQDLADAAYREGEQIRALIGPTAARTLPAKTVRLETGTPIRSEGSTTFPIVWEATGARLLFPRMEGDLIVASMGPDLTQLMFRGSYRPPLGTLGKAMDRTILHRVAEASVRGFVERIACALTEDSTNLTAAGTGPDLHAFD